VIVGGVLWLGGAMVAHPHHPADPGGKPEEPNRSSPGDNPWNQGQEPEDWWGAIKRMHGHVGPWNVLGWRIGKASLREFGTEWGRHELDMVCCIPMQTPYSCMADGLVIGTGNSIGRLDIRLAEVMSMDLIHVGVRRKDGTGPVLIFRPKVEYLRRIESRPEEDLEKLSRECGVMNEGDLFEMKRIEVSQKRE
jgi:formylmethanofuran dehydrogenase subunit E